MVVATAGCVDLKSVGLTESVPTIRTPAIVVRAERKLMRNPRCPLFLLAFLASIAVAGTAAAESKSNSGTVVTIAYTIIEGKGVAESKPLPEFGSN